MLLERLAGRVAIAVEHRRDRVEAKVETTQQSDLPRPNDLMSGVPPIARSRVDVSGHEQPESCQPIFATLLAQGVLSTRDVWVRFRLAHEAGNFRLAARIVAELPAPERPSLREFQRIDRGARVTLVKGEFRWTAQSRSCSSQS